MPSSGLSLPEIEHLRAWFARPGARAARPSSPFVSDALAAVAEAHGVLRRAHRRGLVWTQPRFDVQLDLQIANAKNARFTRDRVVHALNAVNIVPLLLKGASSTLDGVVDPDARPMGDIDILVSAEEVEAAADALDAAGWAPPSGALPLWHLRLWHFNTARLHRAKNLIPVDIHWSLHAEALGVALDADSFRSRSVPVDILGARASVAHPADQWIHLATHFASHLGARFGDPDLLRLLAESANPAARLRWIGDLVDAWEAVRTSGISEALSRIRNSNAELPCADALAVLLPLLDPDGYAGAAAIAAALPEPRADIAAIERRGRQSHAVDTTFGIRPATLRLWWSWVTGGGRRRSPMARALHAFRVATRTAVAAGTLPLALAMRAPKASTAPAAATEAARFEALAEREEFHRRERDAVRSRTTRAEEGSPS